MQVARLHGFFVAKSHSRIGSLHLCVPVCRLSMLPLPEELQRRIASGELQHDAAQQRCAAHLEKMRCELRRYHSEMIVYTQQLRRWHSTVAELEAEEAERRRQEEADPWRRFSRWLSSFSGRAQSEETARAAVGEGGDRCGTGSCGNCGSKYSGLSGLASEAESHGRGHGRSEGLDAVTRGGGRHGECVERRGGDGVGGRAEDGGDTVAVSLHELSDQELSHPFWQQGIGAGAAERERARRAAQRRNRGGRGEGQLPKVSAPRPIPTPIANLVLRLAPTLVLVLMRTLILTFTLV
eukprot:274477-Pleurochrysis_carterae.AAC.7